MAKSRKNSTTGKKVAFLFHEDGPLSPAVLGGKGAGLTDLVRLGVPVPPGFTVTTSVARAFAQHAVVPRRMHWQLRWDIAALERETGKRFGDAHNPLLVSVRSGAMVSMPGMMDTILNLGMNPQVAYRLGRRAGRRFAWDCYRRFLSMFGEVVLCVPKQQFESILASVMASRGAATERELDHSGLQELCGRYRHAIQLHTGKPMPDDAWTQLDMAVLAVLRSWENHRAWEYRRANNIPHNLGTAVNIQAMVFGNLGPDSCTGVVFSRNVATGAPGIWGEFLPEAQGEDVVAGTRTPLSIEQLREWNLTVYEELVGIVSKLDKARRKAVDVEFTVEAGKLYVLQVRGAKLTPEAAVTIATHFVWDKTMTKEEALASVSEEQLRVVRAAGFDPAAVRFAELVGQGIAASPGAAVGRVVTTSAEAVAQAKLGRKVVLVRPDTSPDDLPGMLAAVAIVTKSGGKSCHAAVVARGMGKPAVVGCGDLMMLRGGDEVSVDGTAGTVMWGAVPLVELARKKEVNLFLRWLADAESKKWPAPRLNFAYIDDPKSVLRLLSDFYVTDAMATAAKGTALELETTRLRIKVHTDVAERLAMYLTVAVGGEIRHSQNSWSQKELEQLRHEFGVEYDGSDRGERQLRSLARLRNADLKTHIRFLELTTAVFENGLWRGSVGGRAWADISRCALQFLNGTLTHSVFADHAFDLQHNNGCVFGKHGMLHGDRYLVRRRLEDKKWASGVTQMYQLLSVSSGYHYGELAADARQVSPTVAELFDKGRKMGVWR